MYPKKMMPGPASHIKSLDGYDGVTHYGERGETRIDIGPSSSPDIYAIERCERCGAPYDPALDEGTLCWDQLLDIVNP